MIGGLVIPTHGQSKFAFANGRARSKRALRVFPWPPTSLGPRAPWELSHETKNGMHKDMTCSNKGTFLRRPVAVCVVRKKDTKRPSLQGPPTSSPSFCPPPPPFSVPHKTGKTKGHWYNCRHIMC